MENVERKRILVPILVILFVACVVFGILILILHFLKNDDIPNNHSINIKFDSPYEGNIFEYDNYLATDRTITYSNDSSGYGESISITEDNRNEFDDSVLFLADWIEIMQLGNQDAYNRCFSSAYIKNHQLQQPFSQQMIYGTHIYHISSSEGNYQYRVEFMLLENDGGLWKDVGHNAILPRYIHIKKLTNGEFVITDIITQQNFERPNK